MSAGQKESLTQMMERWRESATDDKHIEEILTLSDCADELKPHAELDVYKNMVIRAARNLQFMFDFQKPGGGIPAIQDLLSALNTYQRNADKIPVKDINEIETASSKCPICGKDSPHYHSPNEATMYNAKFVGVGPQYVQDALQEIYAAMDAMRRKGARENQDIGYNAGFNVSADILEAALKKVKEKLGFMADRLPG